MFIEGSLIAGALALAYRYRANIKSVFTGEAATVVAKGSAFARVAEQEGKLIALRTTTAVKKDAALAAHKALDEVDSLLG